MRALYLSLLLLLLGLNACMPEGSDGGPTGRPVLGPVKLRGFGPRVAVGAGLVVVIRADGTLWAWGDNSSAQLGNLPWPERDVAWRNTPRRVDRAGTRWVDCAGGGTMTLAVQANGTLWSWGANEDYQLGRPGLAQVWDPNKSGVYPRPQPVQGGQPWRHVAAGWGFGAGIRRDGTLWVWGQDSSLTRITQPRDTTWVKVAAGSSHCLALRRDGSLWAWGNNGFGQLGVDAATAPNFRQFVRVGSGRQWRDMAAGRDTSVGLQADGSFWLWSENTLTQTKHAPLLRPTLVVFPPRLAATLRLCNQRWDKEAAIFSPGASCRRCAPGTAGFSA